MDFELTKEQRDIQHAAREFVEAEFDRDAMVEFELSHEFPWELWRKACKLGFLGVDYPEEYGGQGYGLMELGLVEEEFCRKGAGVGLAIIGSNFGAKTILYHGTEEQKGKYLPPLFKGEALMCGALTEPNHGSDITFLDTTAVKDGNDYVINGNKTFSSQASRAWYSIVLCQTDPEAKPGYRGQSAIIVEMDREGIEVSDFEKMGWKPSATCNFTLNNVKVPQENLVGEENRGFYNMFSAGNDFRTQTGFMAVGMAQGAFDRALEHAKTREAFGQKIGAFQAISHRLADMATKIETARLLTYKAAWEFDKGITDYKLWSMVKWYSARVAVEVCDAAIDVLGGHGYMLENEVERFYRDAKALEIVEGTRDIQKNLIARELLGKLS